MNKEFDVEKAEAFARDIDFTELYSEIRKRLGISKLSFKTKIFAKQKVLVDIESDNFIESTQNWAKYCFNELKIGHSRSFIFYLGREDDYMYVGSIDLKMFSKNAADNENSVHILEARYYKNQWIFN